MNENNEYTNSGTTPYKATGNLNTAIGNPRININDTMNVNIQSMATNNPSVNNEQNYNNGEQIQTNNNQFVTEVTSYTTNNNINPTMNNEVNNNVSQVTMQNTGSVNKTYVTTDNKPKKKTVSLNMGPEFKIALLIIVVLLVFVFLLPMITDVFNGY